MKSGLKITAVVLVLFVAAFPLSACSQKAPEKKTGFGNASQRNDGASQTELVGKVTSVIGNQVVLALGTLNSDTEKSGDTAQGSGSASDKNTASSSGGITLTGESATVLIPVGLTISDSSSRGNAGSGAGGGRSSGAQAGGTQSSGSGGFSRSNGGGTGRSGSGSFGGGSNRSGSNGGNFGGGSASGSGGTASGSTTMTMGSLQRSQDFSSITKGMILRIAERTQSDGTQGVIRVSVISE